VRGLMTNNCIETSSKIEDILTNFNSIIAIALTKIKNKTDIESINLEIASIFKETIFNLKVKIEALTLIITELLDKEKISEAQEIYIQYQSKLNELIQDLNNAIDKINETSSSESRNSSDSEGTQYKLLSEDFINAWKNQKSQFYTLFNELEEKISKQLEDWIALNEKMVNEDISRLQVFYQGIKERLSALNELINKQKIPEAELFLKDIQDQTLLELNYQKVRFNELNSDLKLHLDNLSTKWDKEIKNTEIAISILISPYKFKLETVLIEQNLSTLESLRAVLTEKVLEISNFIEQKKFSQAEKILEDFEAHVKKNFEDNRKTLEQIYQTPSPSLEDLIFKWKSRLNTVEKEFQDKISECKEKIRIQHQDLLHNKVEMFIDQSLKALNALIDKFKNDIMNKIKLNRKDQEIPIKREYRTKKREIKKGLNDKKKHLQLVFSRYAEYSLDDLIEKWNEQFKVVEDRFNAAQATVINFIIHRAQINKILDKYYDMAKPAYGYKVPLKALSESLEMPPDTLENLFVDLISYNFIEGEIDPITKVIILPPRIQKVSEQTPKQFRCMVCNLFVNPSYEEVVHCPYCNQPAHYIHLIEWIKVKGKCPNCKREIKML